MIIVYASLVLAALSVIFFAASLVRIAGPLNHALARISKVGAVMKERSETINHEKNELMLRASRVRLDVLRKRNKIQTLRHGAEQAALRARVIVAKGKNVLRK